MASNNDARKKQKKTKAVTGNEDSSNTSLSISLPTPKVQVVSPALSFGNIVNEFSDLLSCALPYIADRVVWNSVASCNREMYKKSKEILPPWPISFKLPHDGCWSWSPCGTCVAFRYENGFVIFDQRLGPRRFNNVPGIRMIAGLGHSPDGRFLVSNGFDGFVRLWDSTGNFEQLQEWEIRREIDKVMRVPSVSVSACSQYMVASLGTCAFLKDVEKRGKTIKSLILPDHPPTSIHTTMFSSDHRAVFIWGKESDLAVMKVWHPYLADDEESRLITLWRQTPDHARQFPVFTYLFSHDKTMVFIYDTQKKKEGTLCSIDMDRNRLIKKSYISALTGIELTGLKPCFTPDDKYIVYDRTPDDKYIAYDTRPRKTTFWSVAEGKCTNNTLHLLDNGSSKKHHLAVESFSPNNQQLIGWKSGNRYISSFILRRGIGL